MNRTDRVERSAALRIALGVDRLKSATTVRARRMDLLHAWHGLEPGTQRSVLKILVVSLLAVFGFWSLVRLGKPPNRTWPQFMLDSVIETMRLFTLQYSSDHGSRSWITQLARLVLPLTASFVAAISLSRSLERRFFARLGVRRGNHLVLVGDSKVTVALARAYRESLDRPVVAIVPVDPGSATTALERAGADLVIGDAREAATLRSAGVQRAAALVAADESGSGAIGLVAAVAEAARHRENRPPLPVVIRLDQLDLRELATVHLTTSLRQSNIELRPYVRERTVARGLLARYPADWGLRPGPHDIHAVLFGLGTMGGELLLQLARIAVPSPGRRTVLTVIDRDAHALRDRVLADYPGLSRCAELRFIQAEVSSRALGTAEVAEWLLSPLPASSVYVCCGDDRANLTLTLALRRAIRRSGGISSPVFVYQREGPINVLALPHIHGRDIDTLRIVAFGGIEEEANPVFLIDGAIDELARQLHDNYAATETASESATVPWSQLDETFRAANRSLADHLQAKLRMLALHANFRAGAMASDRWQWAASEQPELEVVAQQEHERWCRDRWLRGWTRAEERDSERLHHPDLVPFDELDEAGRDKDRRIVVALPDDLGKLGMGVKRDRRVGIWFESDAVAPSEGLVEALRVGLAKRLSEEPTLHCQLVLPLRASAEWAIATTLATDHDIAIDVAILESCKPAEVRPEIDRTIVQRLIAAADRAFVLLPNSEGAGLSALCDVCDSVWLVGERRTSIEPLLHQVGGRPVEIVALDAPSR